MWKTIANLAAASKTRLIDNAKRTVTLIRNLSRPVRVVVLAASDVTKTRTELIAENALLRHQLIASKRHLKRPRISKPEKVAMLCWARLTTWWRTAILLVQPGGSMPELKLLL